MRARVPSLVDLPLADLSLVVPSLAAVRGIRLAAILCLMVLCATGTARAVQNPISSSQSATLARIFAAWEARQARVQSLHFTWDCRVSLPKGYLAPNDLVVGGLKSARPQIAPASAHYAIPQSAFWAEGGDRSRYEFFTVVCREPNDWKRSARIRATIDGERHTRLHVPVDSGGPPYAAVWNKAKVRKPTQSNEGPGNRQWDAGDDDLAPLRLAFRPLHSMLGWRADRCRLVSENAVVGRTRCVELRIDDTSASERCFVDPNRDYAIVMWQKSSRSLPLISVTIDYLNDKVHGWVPTRWTWLLPGLNLPGRVHDLTATAEAVVTTYAINERAAADTFAPAFGPPIRVFDVTAESMLPADDANRGTAKQAQPAAPSLDAIVAAWSKRQAEIKSFKFTWREQTEGPRTNPDSATQTLAVDGERFSFCDNAHGVPTRTAFDGASMRTYWGPFVPNRGPVRPTAGHGRIYAEPNPHSVPISTGRPLLQAFRPLHPESAFISPYSYRVSPNRGKIGGVSCVIIESIDEEPRRYSYWLDPAREYLVLREHHTRNGQDTSRTDLSYRHDESHGWVPVGWKSASVDNWGDLEQSVTATVTEWSVNQPLPLSEFRLEFPKDTLFPLLPRKRPERTLSELRGRVVTQEAPKNRPKAMFDPFTNAVADVNAALKTAKDRHQRVLVEFGDNWSYMCCELGVLLKENANISAAIQESFVLVLVDESTKTGRVVQDTYGGGGIPHLAVIESDGNLLKIAHMPDLGSGGEFDIARLKAFLDVWSPSK
jgi:Thioredoxin-like